jgi:ribonuclease HI
MKSHNIKIKKLIAYIDGASKGNPGKGACAAILYDEKGKIIAEEGLVLGRCTNNFAEYSALKLAIDIAKRYGTENLTVFSDSQLVVRQINGQYSIKNPELKKLYDIVMKEKNSFKFFNIEYIPRAKNKIADKFLKELFKSKKLSQKQQIELQKEREKDFENR